MEKGKLEHMCQPQKYQLPEIPIATKPLIVKAPNFQVIPATQTSVEKLIVKDAVDNTLQYTYSWSATTKSYVCNGCRTRKIKKYVSAKIMIWG